MKIPKYPRKKKKLLKKKHIWPFFCNYVNGLKDCYQNAVAHYDLTGETSPPKEIGVLGFKFDGMKPGAMLPGVEPLPKGFPYKNAFISTNNTLTNENRRVKCNLPRIELLERLCKNAKILKWMG